MIDKRNIDLTEEELISKIIERVKVSRLRHKNKLWELGDNKLYNLYYFSEQIDNGNCSVEQLLNAAMTHRKLYRAKLEDGTFVAQMHSREDDGDYSDMFYIDKLLELKNPVLEYCETCNQKLPGIGNNAVKTFLNQE